jgi:DNA-binding GntR family transcriptional regulator
LTTPLTIIGYNLFLQPYESVLFDAPLQIRTIDEQHLAGSASAVCLGHFAGRKESLETAMLIESVTPRSVSVPLLTVTKAEAVYIETRSRILKGALAPGSAVNQEALAAELGVSITPLREALRRLEMEGLIRLEAHRTMIITPLTSQELHEMYAIRIELDPLAAGLAAVNGSKSQLELIRELAQQKAVSDPILQLERNRGFHRAVYSSSQNGALTSLLDQLWDRTDRYRVILIREELVEGPTSRQEHIELASAIGARKAAPAARLMRAHIERSHTRIADIVKTRATDTAERLGPGSQGNP